MGKKNIIDFINSISLPDTSSADLRGKQSVRATFKLTKRAINAINIVSTHLGIKQKSLFDHLIEDVQALNLIAREMESYEFQDPDRVQKTYVLSRRTLSFLDDTCRSFNAPRDALVELTIQRLLPVITKEKEKHEKRKKILDDLGKLLKEGEKLLIKTKRTIEMDDPAYDQVENAVTSIYDAYKNLDAYIVRSKIIEDF